MHLLLAGNRQRPWEGPFRAQGCTLAQRARMMKPECLGGAHAAHILWEPTGVRNTRHARAGLECPTHRRSPGALVAGGGPAQAARASEMHKNALREQHARPTEARGAREAAPTWPGSGAGHAQGAPKGTAVGPPPGVPSGNFAEIEGTKWRSRKPSPTGPSGSGRGAWGHRIAGNRPAKAILCFAGTCRTPAPLGWCSR